MIVHGWSINLTGADIPVYDGSKNWYQQGNQIGKLTKNECFAEGTAYGYGAGWEGWGVPVYFKNSSGVITLGAIKDDSTNIKNFAEYASNGTSWSKVSTTKRKVKYATKAYYSDGTFYRDLPAGSFVWLTSNASRGAKNPNYVSVSKIQPVGGDEKSFNGFIDLTYGGRWLNVGSILLRKA